MSESIYPKMGSTAWFDSTGLYRYELTRRWERGPYACFILLNPSTADAVKDDQTIRKCCSYARRWNMGGIVVVNVFAWRATDPKDLFKVAREQPQHHDMITGGQLNDDAIHDACVGARAVIAGWGVHGGGRALDVLRLLLIDWRREVHCLGVTQDYHPRHPLYVRGDATPVSVKNYVTLMARVRGL